MPIVKVKPEGDYCQDVHVLPDSLACPDLDDTKTMEPRCTKYNCRLTWNMSGRVHKCRECLDQNEDLTAKLT